MARFSDALAANPAPRRLGDVELSYEPSILVGEATRPPPTWRPTVSWTVGLVALVAALGVFVASGPAGLAAGLSALGALALVLATWLTTAERRTRRFVADFARTRLRLDFVTAFAGHPRTLLVPFEDVRAVDLRPQAGPWHCVTVDFDLRGERLRDVLAAFVEDKDLEAADRLRRLLEGAFGLGAPTAGVEEAPSVLGSYDSGPGLTP